VLWQDYNNIGHAWLMPLEKIPAFVLLLAEYGFYTEGCILADAQLINPDHSTQAARVAAVYDVTAGLDSVFTQLGNEWEKNGYDPGRFARPADGRICTNASAIENGQDAPYWDYFTFSGQRSPLNHAIREYGPIEFMYGDAGTRPHGPMPAICGEGMKPGVNADDPRDFERAGAQARSGCGGRYHTVSGTGGNSCLFTELEDTCGRAFVRGLAGGDA
jgi:hypothetical protein